MLVASVLLAPNPWREGVRNNMRKILSGVTKRRPKALDPLTAAALDKLGGLARSSGDRSRVMRQVADLRSKGVPLKVLADSCGVTARTISTWQARGRGSETVTRRQKRTVKPITRPDRPPEIKVVDVVRPDRSGGLWPKINMRAEWVRVRFSLELL